LCTLLYSSLNFLTYFNLSINKEKHTILYYLDQINFIMLHDELPPVQHPIHYTVQKNFTY
jgi:hypothetical protein